MKTELAQQIESKLQNQLSIDYMEIIDDTDLHRHHSEAKKSSSKGHIQLILVSSQFEKLNRVQRSSLIYEMLSFQDGGLLHALSMRLYTPLEWQQRSQK